jgi:hypothetical protein
MKNIINYVILTIYCLLFATYCYSGVGTTEYNFLRIAPSARQVGMAEVATAIVDDSSSSYFNPAGLVHIKKQELSFTHLSYLEGINYEYFAYALRITRNDVIAANAIYLNSGKMDRVEEDSLGENYTKVGEFSYENLLTTFSYSRYILTTNSVRLSLGINTKLALARVDNTSSTISVDVGGIYERPLYRIGVVIQNLGKNLPLTIRAGIGTKVLFLDNILTTGVDVVWNLDTGKIKGQVGLEYWLFNLIIFRAGYKTNYDLENVSLGAGFKFGTRDYNFILDYAYTPYSEGFNSTHRFSITIKF